MKLLQARRLELKIISKNGLIDKLLSYSMPVKNCFKSLKNQSFTLMKKITKKLSMKFKVLLGKRKESPMNSINLRNFGKP